MLSLTLPPITVYGSVPVVDYEAEDRAYELQEKGESLIASGKPMIFYAQTGTHCFGFCEGDTVTIFWYAVHANTCTAHGSWEGSKPLIGREVIPLQPTFQEYTLTCERNGVQSPEVRIFSHGAPSTDLLPLPPGASSFNTIKETYVPPHPGKPTLTLVVSNLRPKKGNEIAIFWDSANVDTCTAYGAWEGEKGQRGEELVPVNRTAVYGLRCSTKDHLNSIHQYNAVGFDSYESNDPRRPKVSFDMKSWDDALIDPGEGATIVWNAQNAVSCTGSGDWSGELGVSGKRVVYPGKTAVYEITCTSKDGFSSFSKDVMISVIEPSESPYRGKFVRTKPKFDPWYVDPVDGKKSFITVSGSKGFETLRARSVVLPQDKLSQIPLGTLDVSGKDSDRDGLSDVLEEALGLNPKKKDSDNDGVSDKEELKKGLNPLGRGKEIIDALYACRVSGKILRTNNTSFLWYVNPDNCKRYLMASPSHMKTIIDGFDVPISPAVLNKVDPA